jgi:hypothetical protein
MTTWYLAFVLLRCWLMLDIRLDSLRKRAWPKLVGLHDLWSERYQQSGGGSAAAATTRSLSHHISTTAGSSGSNSNIDGDTVSVSSQHSIGSGHDVLSSPLVQAVHASVDADQIALDVARCTWHLLTGTQRVQRLQMEHKRNRRVAKLIRKKQQRLALLINTTLVQSYATTTLRYYQGYHDVACIFLSVLGGVSGMPVKRQPQVPIARSADVGLASAVLLQISQHHLRDCLQTNFTSLQTTLRCTIFPLIAVLDPEVHNHLYECGMEPFFALSWILTWFAHEVRDTEAVKRLFDAFLVSHALLPLYMSVAMVVHPTNRQEILDTECDFSLLHQTLRGLPKNSSLVGWKYRPGDGYVSDDDRADDSATVSTVESGSMDAEILLLEKLDHDNIRSKQSQREDHTASVVSSNFSSSILGPPAPVAFQELLENALNIMRRIPPQKLLGLASRYYGKQQVDDMLANCDVMYMLEKGIPDCMVQGSAKADWVYKEEARDGRCDRESALSSYSKSAEPASSSNFLQFVKIHPKSPPVIALGFGNGNDDERKRRKRRKMILAIAVAIVAVAVGVAMRYDHTTMTAAAAPSVVDSTQELKSAAAVATATYTTATMGKQNREMRIEGELTRRT